MAFLIKDRVLETCSSPGTGAVTLLGAVTGYQSFSTAFSSTNGTTTYYCIADQGGANWEVGLGTWNTGNTFTRTTVYASSNAGATVNFASGTQNVFCTYPAEYAVYQGGPLGTPSSGTVTNLTGTASININGTVGATTANTGAFTTLTSTSDATLHGLTVGLGGGSVSTNTAVGVSALASGSLSGGTNTGVGYQSLNAVTSGDSNSGFGTSSLTGLTTGTSNTAVGRASAGNTTTGSYNTAVGRDSLLNNTTGSYNTAVGYQAALYQTGGLNDAFGQGSLFGVNGSSTGQYNSAIGKNSLSGLTTGNYNVAVGQQALYSNTTASNNTAVGYQAGYSNTTGAGLTAIGYQAGNANTTANYSTFIGQQAGLNTTGTYNTFVGTLSGYLVTSGTKNTIIGAYPGNQGGLDIRTSSNYIVLSDGDGNPRLTVDNNGNFFVGTGLLGASQVGSGSMGATSSANGQQCYTAWNKTAATNPNYFHYFGVGASTFTAVGGIYYNGTLTVYGTASDQRLKQNIVDSGSGLAKLANVKIRSFDWIDSGKNTDFGVIAQELNEVAPEAVVNGIDKEDGSIDKPWAVDTSVLTPAIIKAIQELNALVTEQATEIAALKAKVGA